MDRGAWWAAVHGVAERLHFHFSLSCTGEGNDNPLQCSCLENPRDGGAWWAAVYGVAQSRTRLKRLAHTTKLPGYDSGKEPTCQYRRPKRWGFDPWEGLLEKEMAIHSLLESTFLLGESHGQRSLESQRVGHDWKDLAQMPLPQLLFLFNVKKKKSDKLSFLKTWRHEELRSCVCVAKKKSED